MLVLKAIQFATTKHKGQERRETGIPYISHPMTVMYLVSKYKQSKHLEELMAAALLHDTLEDTETDFIELATEFSPMVADLVLELTSDIKEIARIGKNEYMKKHLVGMSSYALVLKLIDRLSNIMDNPTEKYKNDTFQLLQHLEEKRILSSTQKRIVNDIYPYLGPIIHSSDI